MKSKILIVPLFALILLLTPMLVFAATDLDMTWDGFGTVDVTFTSGDDAIAQMFANGNTGGWFYAQDTDNAAGYGIDDSSAWMDSYITTGGGFLEFTYTRTSSMNTIQYNDPTQVGQVSYSRVASSDGTGILDFGAGSNYAYMNSYTYPNALVNFQAEGSSFDIYHRLTSSDPLNYGALAIFGSGSASVTHAYDMSGYSGDSFAFGAGTGGSVWGTSITATGSGTAIVGGEGMDYLRDGSYGQSSDWELLNGGSFSSTWNYNDGLEVTDYGFYGD